MPQIPPLLFEQLLSRATDWVEKQEQFILNHEESRALTVQEQEIARQAGVQRPEGVRILAVPEIPFPQEAELRAAAEIVGLSTRGASGLTVGHGIFVRHDLADDAKLVTHELRHVAQYERRGSILAFLRRYLFEVNEFGYPDAPMEQDAIAFAEYIWPP